MRILNISFDRKVKGVIAICIVIAAIIIVYSFKVICVDKGLHIYDLDDTLITIRDYQDILNIDKYEVDGEYNVYSNKTLNKYKFNEVGDIKNNRYTITYENNIILNYIEDTMTQNKDEFEFKTNTIENNFNPMCIGNIISKYQKLIIKNDISNLKKEENKDEDVYILCIDEDDEIKVNKIEIIVNKNTCKANEIKMYNKEGKTIYLAHLESFKVKN